MSKLPTLSVPCYTIYCEYEDPSKNYYYEDWCSFPNSTFSEETGKHNINLAVRDPMLPNGFVLSEKVDDYYFNCDYPIGNWDRKSEKPIRQTIVDKNIYTIPASIVKRFDDYCFEQCY